MSQVVIIGNGITGITAARHIRKAGDCDITVISSETPHFYSRTALMYIFMGHMTYEDTKPYEDHFWDKNRIRLVQDTVVRVDSSNRRVMLKSGDAVGYDSLIISTGSTSNMFGWPGQDLKGVQGLYSMDDLHAIETYSQSIQHAVVVGGGLIGIELTEMLLSRNISVSFLIREDRYWTMVLPDEEARMIEAHIKKHKVDLRLGTELKEILPDDNGRVRAVVTSDDETIPCGFVGLTVGVSPSIGFLEGSGIDTDRGVLVNEFFETNVTDVYAGGDCAQFRTPPPGRRPVEQVWYTGKMHGEHIAANVCGNRRPYQPGIWFNSAKFFDVEYQTYGMVPSRLPEDQGTFYWEHPSGEKSVRINYMKDDLSVVGFNLFGIRVRHAVCEHWIAEKRTLDHVLAHLGAMNFDPEFFESWEQGMLNRAFPSEKRTLETKKGLFTPYLKSLFNR